MAINTTSTYLGTTATVAAAGTSVAPLIAIPDNCHTLIIYNSDSTNTIYAAVDTAGGALNADTSINVPPNSSLTLSMGVQSERVGSYDLVYDASGGTNVKARITYVNGLAT
jgi:hypothetical protein